MASTHSAAATALPFIKPEPTDENTLSTEMASVSPDSKPKVESEEQKPSPSSSGSRRMDDDPNSYSEYRLLSTNFLKDGWKYNTMRLVPSSSENGPNAASGEKQAISIDLKDWPMPVRLNRRDQRKLRQEKEQLEEKREQRRIERNERARKAKEAGEVGGGVKDEEDSKEAILAAAAASASGSVASASNGQPDPSDPSSSAAAQVGSDGKALPQPEKKKGGRFNKKKTVRRFVSEQSKLNREIKRQENAPWVLEDGRALGLSDSRRSRSRSSAGAMDLDESEDEGEKWTGGLNGGTGIVKGDADSGFTYATGDDSPSYVYFVVAPHSHDLLVVPANRDYKFLRVTKPRGWSGLGFKDGDKAAVEYEKHQKGKDLHQTFLSRDHNAPVALTSSVAQSAPSAQIKREPDGPSAPTRRRGFKGFARPERRDPGSILVGGKFRRLRTVDDGGSSRGRRGGRDDDDDWGRREDDAYDEVPFENEFQDDEEGVGGLGLNEDEKGAMDDEEAKELEERIKRDMRNANRSLPGGGVMSAEIADLEEEDEEGGEQRDVLSKGAKQLKKIVSKLAGAEGVESEDDDDDDMEDEGFGGARRRGKKHNPYASEEEESDIEFEEVDGQVSDTGSKNGDKSAVPSGTTTPTRAQPIPLPTANGHARPSALPDKAKVARPGGGNQSQPASRSGSPIPAGPGAGSAIVAKRATSPRPVSKKPSSRATSPSAPSTAGAGTKRKADEAVSGGPSQMKKARSSQSTPGSPDANGQTPSAAPIGDAAFELTDALVIDYLRNSPPGQTKAMLAHFGKYFAKFPGNKGLIGAIMKRVAVLDKGTGVLSLKEGL